MENCIFCSIVQGNIPSKKIYEDSHTYAFLDISCDYEAHTLVVPKFHCDNMLSCPADVMAHVNDTVVKVSNHYINNCGYSAVNVISNCGQDAGQTVMHMHVHIIPRKHGDSNMPFAQGAGCECDLEQLAVKLAL